MATARCKHGGFWGNIFLVVFIEAGRHGGMGKG
jgi:hypothetical protein